jgi:hypothetical protein
MELGQESTDQKTIPKIRDTKADKKAKKVIRLTSTGISQKNLKEAREQRGSAASSSLPTPFSVLLFPYLSTSVFPRSGRSVGRQKAEASHLTRVSEGWDVLAPLPPPGPSPLVPFPFLLPPKMAAHCRFQPGQQASQTSAIPAQEKCADGDSGSESAGT